VGSICTDYLIAQQRGKSIQVERDSSRENATSDLRIASSAKALPILFSGFKIAFSFEVSEEGGLHGTPTEAFVS
jgi:hypothetical protein